MLRTIIQILEDIRDSLQLITGEIDEPTDEFGPPSREPDATIPFDSPDYEDELTRTHLGEGTHEIGIAPDGQPALEITYPEAETPDACRMQWDLEDAIGYDPETAYVQYSLCLPEDYEFLDSEWNHGGSKIPGVTGNYQGNATSGRQPEGESWSVRPYTANPGEGEHRQDLVIPGDYGIGAQIYHMDQEGSYGDETIFSHSLDFGEFHDITLYIDMNDPDRANGKLTIWVDDTKVYDRDDLRYRDNPETAIRDVWVGFYFGGAWGPQRDKEKTWMRDLSVWSA